MKIKMGSIGLLALAAALWTGSAHAQTQNCNQSPADPQASNAAKNVLCYIKTHTFVTGQTDTGDGDKVMQLTGRYPAIIAFDFYGYTDGYNVGSTDETRKAIDWAKTKKGIVAFQWHWKCPRGGGQFSGNCDFDQDLNNPNSALYQNIDLIVKELKKMGDEGVPVLFRPLHEANNNYMWWAKKGQENYKKLWALIYNRAQLAGAHNILWVFNGMANGQGTSMASWYPGDQTVDFVTSDYFQSWNDYNTIKGIGNNKTLGVSETMNQIKPSSDAPWPFSIVWASRDWNGTSAQDWKNAMNDSRSITIDQLPDFNGTPPNSSSSVNSANGEINIALNKPTSTTTTDEAVHGSANAVDGNSGTRWSSSFADANSITVDLGGLFNVSRVKLNWEVAYGKAYQIQFSSDNVNWTTAYSTTTGDGAIDDIPITTLVPVSARWVRMNGVTRATQWGYSLWDFEVYGTPANSSSSSSLSSATPNCDINIGGNKLVTATSIDEAGHPATYAVDGNGATRWSSNFTDANSISVDLGGLYNVCRVKLTWEVAFGKAYQIQVSTDNINWATVYSTNAGDGGIDDIKFTSTVARYVRMNGITRATAWGYSLWEFEVFGTPVTSSSATSAYASTSKPNTSSTANPGGLVHVDVRSILNGRSVSTFTNGKIVPWTTGFDGNWSGEATLAVAQALGNSNPKALPNDGFFPANTRHPDVQLHFSNADGVGSQSRYVTGTAAIGFDVPTNNYSTMHIFVLSANGSSMIDVDLMYSNGTVRKSFEVPDWYNSVNDADRYVLADDLDKWSNTNARLEQGHHYIIGVDLHPDANRVLNRIVINKQNAGALTFWGATGVAVSTNTSVPALSSKASVSAASVKSSLKSVDSSSVLSIASSKPASSTPALSSSRSSVQSSSGGTPGTFRVDGAGNITKNGAIFPVKCGNWFGLEGQFEPKNAAQNPGGAPMELLMGNQWWANTGRTVQQTMTEIKAKGINMIRLPIAPQTLDATNPQGIGDIRAGGVLKAHASVRQTNARQALESFIKLAAQNNIQVLVDIHSCSNYVGWRKGVLDAKPPYADANRPGYDFTREEYSCAETGNPSSVKYVHAYNEAKWLANLKEVAGLSKKLGVDNIIGIDIFNEPWGYSWEEWKTLSEHAYQAINSVNPDILVFVEGVSGKTIEGNLVPFGDPANNPNWGENLFGQSINPLDIPKERLVLSPHTYGPSVFVQKQFMDPTQPNCTDLEGDSAAAAKCRITINAAKLAAGWDEHFGSLRAQGYAMVVGEFGGNMDWPRKTSSAEQALWSHITTNVDQQWQNVFTDYMKAKNIQACYWAINPESGDTLGWYTTPFDPVNNTADWGKWSAFDQRKTDMLNRLWGQ